MTTITFVKTPQGDQITKSPGDVLDYSMDWIDWLAEGDTITASEWAVPTGITEDSNSATTTVTTIWLSGGTENRSYTLTCKITTTQGRTKERSFIIKVEDQ